MSINTKSRTNDNEIMDDFDMQGDVLQEALDKIAKINQLLGGNKLTLNGVKKMLKSRDISTSISIIDIGCGNGDMLRKLADFGSENNLHFDLIGVDANKFTIEYAKKISVLYPNVRFINLNIFDQKFLTLKYDIVLCTLTLHHFKEQQILDLLKIFYEKCTIGIIINDLQRSKISYRLFQILCVLFDLNKMSKQDGLVSILRGFKKHDLVKFSEKMNFLKFSIQWKWAFRYEWIINK